MGFRPQTGGWWLALWAAVAIAGCPNYLEPPYCSGHGDCTMYGRCECWSGWTGGDCSLRTCPLGTAWNDVATAEDTAHAKVECSNRGECDRLTGRCACDAGFAGSACDRWRCQGTNAAGEPQACSGHGVCASMADKARWEYNDVSVRYSYETPWDAEMIHGCLCSEGYHGPACTLHECPLGDDPLTGGQHNEIQIIACGGEGSFSLRFKGYKSGGIRHDTTRAEFEAAIEEMGPSVVGDVDVRYSWDNDRACHAEQASFDERNVISIEFRTLFGSDIPQLVPVDTEGFAGTVELKTVALDGAEGAFLRSGASDYVYAQQGSKEYEECAGRGACDSTSGACECFSSNFELYGSSNLYGRAGLIGDCGYPLTDITTCPGEETCSNNGVCVGDGVETDATPMPTPHFPQAEWKASKPFNCVCKVGWRLGDCSERLCPRGPAWFSYPSSNDAAHTSLVECSGVGTCNRVDGNCECPEPFTGGACEAMQCPGSSSEGGASCNGVGRCLSMRELAERASFNGVATSWVYGSDPNDGATWDADRIHGCLCDDGYAGHDCALRTCPFGDDPGTWGQHNELQLLRCLATDGTFTLTFREATTSAVPYDATSDDLKAALEALSTIGTIQVAYSHGTSACTSTGTQNVISVRFVTEHSDVPPLVASASALSRGTLTVKFVVATDGDSLTDGAGGSFTSEIGTTEAEECSNRGLCDHLTGQCQCFKGYGMSDGLGGPGTIADCGYKRPYR